MINKDIRIRQINANQMSYYDENIKDLYLTFFRDVKGYVDWEEEEILNSTTDDDIQEFFTCIYDLFYCRYLNTNYFKTDKLKRIKIVSDCNE